jgi:hypothetical protein
MNMLKPSTILRGLTSVSLGVVLLAMVVLSGCKSNDQAELANFFDPKYFITPTPEETGEAGEPAENENVENNDPTPTPTPTPTATNTPTPTPTPVETPTPTPEPTPYDGISDFSGVTSIDEVTDTTAILHWTEHEDAAYYVAFKRELGENGDERYKVIANINAGESAFQVKGLKIDTPYSFMVKAHDDEGRTDNNEVQSTIRTLLAPPMPAAISLTDPESSPAFKRRPTFTVRYVKPGETVKIFKDAECTEQLASGVVGLDQTTIDLQTMKLTGGTDYEVYANVTSIYGHTSVCSVAYATYHASFCPIEEMYVHVPGNEDLGTEDFCVMKTEAKKGDGNIPISSWAKGPWVSLKPSAAKAACKSIAMEDVTCDLISNAQWQTIARNIEGNAVNWSNGAVGSGKLSMGHGNYHPSTNMAISDPSYPYDEWGESASTKRTHVLSNDREIWDFAGNVSEWVDWEYGGDTFTLGPDTCDGTWQELYDVNCAALNPNDYMPANPADIAPANYTLAKTRIGKLFGTTEEQREASAGGAAARGGNWVMQHEYASAPAIFTLYLNYGPNQTGQQIGFRCVCIPN